MNSWHIAGRYDFSIPEAQKLSDLAGIDVDLDAVIRICARCVAKAKEIAWPTEDSRDIRWYEELQSLGDLSFAAVVRYGRTFGSGTRSGIPAAWISTLPEALRDDHAYFKALRDKYVAHSVNELEDNQVFVLLKPQIGEHQEATSITVDRGRLVGIDPLKLETLSELASALKGMVVDAIDVETEMLLTVARSMRVEDIRARGTYSSPLPDKAATFKVRKKF